jgi:hypothetical protein
MKTHPMLLAAAACLVAPFAWAEDSRWKVVVVEDPVLDATTEADGASLAMSLDARRVAWRAKRDGKWVVVREGATLGAPWDDVVGITWTGDGTKLVFWGKRGDRWHLVANDFAIPVDGKPHWVDERTIVVAPVGGRYAAYVNEGAGFRVIVDGSAGPLLESAPELVFSPDGGRYAYAAGVGGGAAVFVDGRQGKVYEGLGGGPPLFSPDSQLVGYVAVQGSEWRAVVETTEGPPFKNVTHLVLGPRGTMVAYAAEREDGRWVVVTDGKPSEAHYDAIADLVMTPNGKHLGVVARTEFRSPEDQSWVVVLDEKGIAEVPFVGHRSLRLTEDAARHAFAVRRGTAWTVVIDGVESETWERVLFPTISFSLDARRVAYVARKAGEWHLVVDGRVGPPWDEVGELRFGPPHEKGVLLAVPAQKDGSPLLWVDGAEVTTDGGGIGRLSYEGPRTVRLLVGKGTTLRRLKIDVQPAP